jgi:hypothetical protein
MRRHTHEKADQLELLVVGGKQRGKRALRAGSASWYKYEEALAIRVDTTVGSASVEHSYVSPPDVTAAEDPAILYKQGTMVDGRLYQTTQTEVLVYDYPSWELEHYISLPRFNDVHHVRPTARGTLLVVNTGLDQVLELDVSGEVVNEWNVEHKDPWHRHDRSVDYRLESTTKPYDAHPNHVFTLGDEVWATRFKHMDAVSLSEPGRRIDIGAERVHDGVVVNDKIYFTTVNGQVAVADVDTLEIDELIDLRDIDTETPLLGWCRGIAFEGDHIWVGFSRLRPTKARENVAWVKDGFKRQVGTHIARYDLAKKSLEQRIDLEPVGLNAVFSIYEV